VLPAVLCRHRVHLGGLQRAGLGLPGMMKYIQKFVYRQGARANSKTGARFGLDLPHARRVSPASSTGAEAIRLALGQVTARAKTDHRRADALGHREPQHRRQAPEGARSRRPDAGPLKVSCLDHEGSGHGTVPAMGRRQVEGDHRLDWSQTASWCAAKVEEDASAVTRKEKGITPRDCSKEK